MMASKSKNLTLLFNKFLRQFKDSLEKFQVKDILTLEQLQDVFRYLGYIDYHASQQTTQLVHTVGDMLSQNRDCLVAKVNLFEFLKVISDFKNYEAPELISYGIPLANHQKITKNPPLILLRLGEFTSNGLWKCNQNDQRLVKSIFQSMNLKKLSRQNVEAEQKKNSDFFLQQTFQPRISSKSRALSSQKYRKSSLSQSKVQDRLLISHSLQKSGQQAKANLSIQRQMKECSFKPKINAFKQNCSSNHQESMNASFQNKQNNQSFQNFQAHSISSQSTSKSMSKSKISPIGDRLLGKGKEYQKNLEKLKGECQKLNEYFHLKQCTFQPRLFQTTISNHLQLQDLPSNQNKLKIRNVDKSIERMKQARKKREFENQVKQRGYPQNIAWTKFINSYKNSETPVQGKTPILCIDLKIMDSTKNIQVYQGQGIDAICQKICVQNQVPHEFWNRVQSLLKSSIEQCFEVKIFQNKVYLNRPM